MIRQFTHEDSRACSAIILACIERDKQISPEARGKISASASPTALAEFSGLYYLVVSITAMVSAVRCLNTSNPWFRPLFFRTSSFIPPCQLRVFIEHTASGPEGNMFFDLPALLFGRSSWLSRKPQRTFNSRTRFVPVLEKLAAMVTSRYIFIAQSGLTAPDVYFCYFATR
jgi:hypothetical protein